MPDPDYIVTRADYDDKHSRLTRVKRWEYDGSASEARNDHVVDRSELLADIEAGEVHYTAPRDGDGDLRWGGMLEIIEIKDFTLIRSDGNPVREDNLGDLPEL